jgi:hypothetical protein
MPELTEAGQTLFDSLTGESPPPAPATTTDFVAPIVDKGPPVYEGETSLQPDPVDPETGKVLDLKSDEKPLEELKDQYRELQQVKQKASETDAARDEFGREQLLARQEFDAMVAMLPPDALTDEFRAQTRERIQQHVRAETVKMLKIVPEWSDPQAADDDRRLIQKHAAKWGFNAAEIGLISDHRMLKYLLDNARAEVRLEGVKLKQAEPKAMAPTAKPGRRSGADKLADLKAAAREGRMSKREAAGQVLLAEALRSR